jgi:hypothetical protein
VLDSPASAVLLRCQSHCSDPSSLRRVSRDETAPWVAPLVRSHEAVACFVTRQQAAGTRRVHQLGQPAGRAGEAQLEVPICRKNVIASAQLCTPVPPPNLHGKEGVEGSSPSEGLYEVPANKDSLSSARATCGYTAGTFLVSATHRDHARRRPTRVHRNGIDARTDTRPANGLRLLPPSART